MAAHGLSGRPAVEEKLIVVGGELLPIFIYVSELLIKFRFMPDRWTERATMGTFQASIVPVTPEGSARPND